MKDTATIINEILECIERLIKNIKNCSKNQKI